MRNIVKVLGHTVGLLLLASSVSAQVTLEFIGRGAALDMSSDGSVVVGNSNGVYETFRWTLADSIVLLGRNTSPAGNGAGTPDVSEDGTVISATILGADSTYVTQGVWTLGSGWQETMPPVPADGGLIDGSYGSAWGLSGDGSTLVGLYWRPGNAATGLAHASKWTSGGGVVDLGSTFKNSRANHANMDGSVIVGWDENPTGQWQPAVWVDSTLTLLASTNGSAQATTVNHDGTIIAGMSWDNVADKQVGAIWRWDGSTWVEEVVGSLFGTHPIFGATQFHDMTPDGSIIIGTNSFDPGDHAGIIWTAADGLVDVDQWLLARGVNVPPNFTIEGLSGISDDGKIMCGIARETVFPWELHSFRIIIEDPTDVPVVSYRVQLGANYPNPFNPSTTIPVVAARGGQARLAIFDIRGRQIRVLHDGPLNEGHHEFRWNGTNAQGRTMANGTYFVRLFDAAGVSASRRLTVLK